MNRSAATGRAKPALNNFALKPKWGLTIMRLAMRGALALAAYSALLPVSAHGQTESVLYSFNYLEGVNPLYVTPVLDGKGNLYGTAIYGGPNGGQFGGGGTVFELTPSGTQNVLWGFGNGTDGYWPQAGLVRDRKGNLYGTTSRGGAYGYGTVFKLTRSGKETVLWSFGNGTDGQFPTAGLVLDKKGNLYGTTLAGGAFVSQVCFNFNTTGCGTVFEITSSGAEAILHSFASDGTDGYEPYAGLVMDKEGNLYGTTFVGGIHNGGTVFRVTSSGIETILLNLGSNGYWPQAGVVLDNKGNLYGTTRFGGGNGCGGDGCGAVFKVTPSGTETILHSFGATQTDGYWPYGGLARDKKGNFYGTTSAGGAYSCSTPYTCGTVYKLTPSGTETILWSFGSGTDGSYPIGGLVLDKAGNLYGTTYKGGANGLGTVFRVTP